MSRPNSHDDARAAIRRMRIAAMGRHTVQCVGNELICPVILCADSYGKAIATVTSLKPRPFVLAMEVCPHVDPGLSHMTLYGRVCAERGRRGGPNSTTGAENRASDRV